MKRRRLYLVDPSFQMREVNRTINAFMALAGGQFAVFAVIAVLLHQQTISAVHAAVAGTMTAFLAPAVLCAVYSWQTVRATHRVAGAAYRLTQDAPRILQDASFRFHLRDGDYLWDLAHELNRVMAVLEVRARKTDELAARMLELEEALSSWESELPPERAATIRLRLGQMRSALTQVQLRELPPACDSEEEAVRTILGETEKVDV